MRWDCHMHMVLDGVDWKASIGRGIDDTFIRQQLAKYQDLGYTWLRDGGDRWGVGARARELAPEYGITYRTPLSPLCKKGHYGSFIGTAFASMREFAMLVRTQRDAGADFIKIMISGLMDFDRFGVLTEPGLPEEEIREVVHIAREEGMSVMVHCNGARTAQAAACAGVGSIEHGAYLDEEAMQAMKEYRVVWVPTLSTIGNLLGKGRFQEAAVKQILDSAMENVSRFHTIGGLVAPGSDAGAWAVPHGCETEESWLIKADVPTDAQQKAATDLMQRF